MLATLRIKEKNANVPFNGEKLIYIKKYMEKKKERRKIYNP